jgi:NAD(P)-dependent dehydrogenase (short-subunit alcohol dehydrogenase family)
VAAESDLSADAALVAGEGSVATAIAEALAACGCRVLLATPVVVPTAATIECVAFDGLDEAQWRQIMRQIAEQTGSSAQRFGIMVNARLADWRCTMQNMSGDEFGAHQRRVLHGAFLGVRFASGSMRAHGGGGSIINVIGLDSRMPSAGASALASSDGGIRMLTKAAALELGPEGIRVNTIQCDVAGPSPRADVQDVARAAVFLASGRSRFMTGADLLIDGGRLAGA